MTNDEKITHKLTFFMLYNIYSTIHFAIQNNYTTFAGVNSKDMKNTMLLMALCAMFAVLMSSCESKSFNDIAGRTYEYQQTSNKKIIYNFPNDYKVYYSIEYQQGNITDIHYDQFYYTYKNKKITIYYNEKYSSVLTTGKYFGTYITLDIETEPLYLRIK